MSEVKPQHLRNAIRDARLSRAEMALLNALIDRADWKTWEVQGFSVRTLAEDRGYCRRHGRRAIHSSEIRGLVERTNRQALNYGPNAYKLAVDEILALPRRRGQPALRLAYEPEDLDQVSAPRRDAGLPRREASPNSGSSGRAGVHSAPAPEELEAEAAPGARTLPRWLELASRAEERDPAELAALVQGAIRLIVRPEDRERVKPGTLARPVLRVWRACDRPASAELLADVAMLVQALDEGCTEDALLHARGLRLVHPRHGRGEVRVEHFPHGQDLRHDVGRLLARSAWSARVSAAHRHAAGRCRCGRHREAAQVAARPASAPVNVLLGAELPRLELLEHTAALRWESAVSALRGELGVQDWEIWIKPLRPMVRDGALVLEAPNRWFAEHLARTYGAALVRLVGGPVWVCHGPPEDDA